MQLNSDLTHTHSVDVSDVAVRTLMKNSERSQEDKKKKKKKKAHSHIKRFSQNTLLQQEYNHAISPLPPKPL